MKDLFSTGENNKILSDGNYANSQLDESAMHPEDPLMQIKMAFPMAQAAIDAILDKSGTEITWVELSKHKVQFVTGQVKIMGEKIIDLSLMQGDQKHEIEDKVESDEDVEPIACTKDRDLPN